MVDWSCIPRELVGTIANNFSTIEDQSAFSAICRSYRFATKGEQWRPASRLPPWLLLCCPDGDEKDGCCNQRGLVSMCRNRRFMMHLPELHGRYFWGTPYGWIITLGIDKKFHLFNPFNRSRIVLPDLDRETSHGPLFNPDPVRFKGDLRRFRTISKVILIKRSSLSSSCSSPASDVQFIVVQTFELGMLKVMRANTWVEVTFKRQWFFVNEVICYQGQIYALGDRGKLLIGSNFEDPTLQPTLDDFVSFNPSLQCVSTEHYYIVESLGQILLVVRYIEEIEEESKYRTCDFEAYKLDLKTKKWIEIEDDLGDCALFVGNCQSISVSNPKDFNCRSNCIYFTDDNYEDFFGRKALNDMGIYDFKARTSEPFYQGVVVAGYFPSYSRPSGLAPWLLLCCPDGDENDGCCNQRGLISMCRNPRRFMMNLPELHGRYFWGTPYGWIVTLSMDNKFHLFNPVNRRRIVLPELDPESNRRPLPSVRIKGDLRRFRSISKVILIKRSSLSSSCSSSAWDDDFIVVKTFELGSMLRVMRGNTWVEVTFKRRWFFVNEVICYQGQIYALGNRGLLSIGSNFDDHTLPPTMDDFVSVDYRLTHDSTEHYYIVESLGQLLLVVRFIEEMEEHKYRTCDFDAYKLDFETKKWIEIEDLGDCALFVGNCQSMSLSNPKDSNCRSNCIYFTDDNYEEFCLIGCLNDMGIYDFKERTIQPFYQGEDSISTYSTPSWLLPVPI